MRLVSDSDSVRRLNRGLVLGALRQNGPMPRSQLATVTGLSNASITAITQDMFAQGVLAELPEERRDDLRLRGRPSVRIGFNRHVAAVCLIELDVNRARFSVVDYGGTLIDRIETTLTPEFFHDLTPVAFLRERIGALARRNPDEFDGLGRIAISVQGILDRDGASLRWSPVRSLEGHRIVPELADAFEVPVTLNKRGRLLAEGTRWLEPDLREARIAAVFVGSTVAMGMSLADPGQRRGDEGATEFGHMNHVPNGALCRCGMRGCIEAYAADYGILRTAFGVPDTTPPAPIVPAADYADLLQRALHGERDPLHAFHIAGRAIGYGAARLLAVFDPSHLVIVGPGAKAIRLMRPEIEAALAASFVCSVNGAPEVRALEDEGEPIFHGLAMQTLTDLDQTEIAMLGAVANRA